MALSAFASLSVPLDETTRLAGYAADRVGEELSHCTALASSGIPVQWNSERSYGLCLLRAASDAAAAEIIARNVGFTLTFVDEEYVFVVGPANCECDQPCVETFDIDDTKDLLAFLRECKGFSLAAHDCAFHCAADA